MNFCVVLTANSIDLDK